MTTKTCQKIIKSNVAKLSEAVGTFIPKLRCREVAVSWTSWEVLADKNVTTICKNFFANWKRTTEFKVSTTYCDTSLVPKECRLTRSRFHKHFTRAFFAWNSFVQLFSSYILAKKTLSYKKLMARTLMKLTTGLDFINILCATVAYKRTLHTFFLITVWLCNFFVKEYWHKSCS